MGNIILGQEVIIEIGGNSAKGKVIALCEYIDLSAQAQVVFVSHDGKVTIDWFQKSLLQPVLN